MPPSFVNQSPKPYSSLFSPCSMSIADSFNGMNDIRLKPRMLRSLLRDHLPDDNRPFPSSSELASVLSHIKIHGLLSEQGSSADLNPKTMEAWRTAVDDWIDRLISLISSNMPDKCWAGICLLGVTCESCTSQRFLESYSLWFQKLLSNMQPASSTHFIKVASCASLADLFTRLAGFPNAKKDATSLAGKVVQPVLNLLNEDGAKAVWEGAIDLLCTVISSFPFSVRRHYENVEGVLVSKMKSSKNKSNMSRKISYCLSLLPRVRGDEVSWSLLMQKILISVNTILNDAFQGLEEETRSSEIMKLLVPPGKDSPPPLGGQLMTEASEQGTKMLSEVLLPRVSTLMHCCCMVVNSPYPVQVTVPIHHLLTLVGRVLQIDGSLHGSLLPFSTALHQELLSTELPALHLDSLDLLIAIIRGVRSQLLPHAAHIVRLLTEYFKRATMPLIRTKIYSIMQILLISFGVGMVLYLSQDVVNNAFADLNDKPASEAPPSTIYTSKSTRDASPKSPHRKRKHASGSPAVQQNGVSNGLEALDNKTPAPLSVKIAALKALEALLTVGGSLRSESWRSSVDSLLINVATNTCDVGWAREGKYANSSDDSQADFQLAALEALLASLLSPTHVRPPYLSHGLELFHRGKQETGTNLAAFCARAILTLDVLIHPRALPLIDAPVAKSPSFEAGFNHNLRSIDDQNDINSWLCDDDETKLSVEVARVEKEIMETRQEPTLGDQPKISSVAPPSNDLGASTSNGSSLNKDVGDNSKKLGVSLKDRGANYDSDSTSIDSLPDIVDADPDSSDDEQLH